MLTTIPSTPDPNLIPSDTFTLQPDWYFNLDASYGELAYTYALVANEDARVYASLKAASNSSSHYTLLPTHPAYVAIVNSQTIDGKSFVELQSGLWMASDDLQVVTPSTFRGILLNQQVDFRFGWVLTDTQSSNAAGMLIESYSRYQVILEIPNREQRVGYVSIGDDEWLPEESLALTDAGVPKAAGRYQCRFIHVDLASQILRAYDACQLVFTTLVSTGENPAWTFPGRFFINHKEADAHLTSPNELISAYYLESVPYFMSYYGDLGLHGVYWHDSFGMPVSHGCINLSPADSRWLYEWANLGDLVIISSGD